MQEAVAQLALQVALAVAVLAPLPESEQLVHQVLAVVEAVAPFLAVEAAAQAAQV
jgi:hypothetical protein